MPCSYLQYVYPFKPLSTAKGSINSDGKLKKIPIEVYICNSEIVANFQIF